MWKPLSRTIVGLGIAGVMVYGILLISQLQFVEDSPKVSEATISNTPQARKTLADRAVQRAKAMITRNADDSLGYAKLAEAYMRKARESGDSGYYVKAEATIQHVLAEQPDDYAARRVLTWIALGKHDFSYALHLPKAIQVSTQDPGLFGNFTVPGGFPNGRRFGDDVVDITVIAAASDLRVSPPIIFTGSDNIDGVTQNDITFNAVMPYAATPLNGRNHGHHN